MLPTPTHRQSISMHRSVLRDDKPRSDFDEQKALGAYVFGHHSSATTSHKRRTAQKDAAHLVPHLKPGMTLLDVGCGPGTITCSFAPHVSPGAKVFGIDPSASVILEAQEHAKEQGLTEGVVSFQQGDGARLPFADGTFDVVHTHQVLLHVTDPVALLHEMARVTKRPGGLISLKEADFGSLIFYASSDAVMDTLQNEWLGLYTAVHRAGGGDPDAGRRLQAWLMKAGVPPSSIVSDTAHAPCYSTPEDRAWWGEMWVQRYTDPESGTRKTTLETGLADEDKLRRVAEAWLAWSKDPLGFNTWTNRQLIVKL
jgi:ubiquinone/menaquinone biosynthesis C-methylase UbiE